MVKCSRRIDGRGLYYLFACVFNIFIYLFYFIFLFKKKRGPERGPEWGTKRGPKGGPEGRVHVLSTPFKAGFPVFAFFKDELEAGK